MNSDTVCTLIMPVPSLVKGGGRHKSSLWHSVVKNQNIHYNITHVANVAGQPGQSSYTSLLLACFACLRHLAIYLVRKALQRTKWRWRKRKWRKSIRWRNRRRRKSDR